MVGPDRPAGQSPFQFGSDATVGLATLAQTAGELISAINRLGDDGNRYAVAALLRQLVEAEYLTWAFAEAEDDAAVWLRSTREERLQIWSPARLRERADDRFPASDYWRHCELGGHPTPDGRMLLPNHASGFPVWALTLDTAKHGSSAWGNLVRAIEQSAYASVFEKDISPTSGAIEGWRQRDPLIPLDAWGPDPET